MIWSEFTVSRDPFNFSYKKCYHIRSNYCCSPTILNNRSEKLWLLCLDKKRYCILLPKKKKKSSRQRNSIWLWIKRVFVVNCTQFLWKGNIFYDYNFIMKNFIAFDVIWEIKSMCFIANCKQFTDFYLFCVQVAIALNQQKMKWNESVENEKWAVSQQAREEMKKKTWWWFHLKWHRHRTSIGCVHSGKRKMMKKQQTIE